MVPHSYTVRAGRGGAGGSTDRLRVDPLDLDAEITAHNRLLDELTGQVAPMLREGDGIGPDTAAEMLIVFGDNPDRIKSEDAFAKLCGSYPIPHRRGSRKVGALPRQLRGSLLQHLKDTAEPVRCLVGRRIRLSAQPQRDLQLWPTAVLRP